MTIRANSLHFGFMPKSPRHDTAVALLGTEQLRARSKIQTAKIIERLIKIGMGEVTGDPAMLGVQTRCNEILLRKALPDLSAVDVSSHVDGSITITINKLA